MTRNCIIVSIVFLLLIFFTFTSAHRGTLRKHTTSTSQDKAHTGVDKVHEVIFTLIYELKIESMK